MRPACREESGALVRGKMRAARRACCRAAATEAARRAGTFEGWGVRAARGEYREHGAHVRDARRVEAQRLVEGQRGVEHVAHVRHARRIEAQRLIEGPDAWENIASTCS